MTLALAIFAFGVTMVKTHEIERDVKMDAGDTVASMRPRSVCTTSEPRPSSAFATIASESWASAAFLLALFGFGAKAGLVPMHVWLPEAHPAAPSPVSALMSGVMLKTAIYGLLRVSFSACNSEEEIEQLCRALDSLRPE